MSDTDRATGMSPEQIAAENERWRDAERDNGLSLDRCPRCGFYGCQCTGDLRNREISDQFKALGERDGET